MKHGKKYISNHYNNLICVSITLTNIYLTYKREIIIHIKPMAMAVTHMAGSRGGRSQCRGSSCLGEATLEGRGKRSVVGGHWLALGYRQICWQTHTANSNTAAGQGLLLPERAFRAYCKGQMTNTPSCDSMHRDLPFPAPVTGTPSPRHVTVRRTSCSRPARWQTHLLFYITLATRYVFIYM